MTSGPFRGLEKSGNRVFKLDISPHQKKDPVFHESLLEPYKVSDHPNRAQPPHKPEDIKDDMK